ncbi:hypothetical protein FNV43_RR11306 [Rhamnella rubrinervis]|uniref:Uncharacterized protein n=1 Tax=Rhamnella rubrinervis TaxID=2594499 RepID=A0A8K0H5F7_9ROSA|nr:hypothetical protein FNV43_RR11306 [Rhamnella rubrinervis]
MGWASRANGLTFGIQLAWSSEGTWARLLALVDCFTRLWAGLRKWTGLRKVAGLGFASMWSGHLSWAGLREAMDLDSRASWAGLPLSFTDLSNFKAPYYPSQPSGYIYTDSFSGDDEHHTTAFIDAKGDDKDSEASFASLTRPLTASDNGFNVLADSRHADRLRSVYSSKETVERGYVNFKRIDFLGSRRSFEMLKRISGDNNSNVFELLIRA